jgi:hypothetical protein
MPPEEEFPKEEFAQPETVVTQIGLSSIGELFSRTWDIFKRRVLTLILLYIISIVLFAVSLGIFLGIGFLFSGLFPGTQKAFIASGGFVGGIAGFLAMCWGMAAFLFAVSDENIGIKDSLGKGWHKLWSFLWLFTILGYVVTGGFLLFLIPGIIFSVWFFFSQFILVREDERGLNAMLKSKEYVRGHWFDIFLRLFVIWIISAALGIIPIIGPILSFVFFPFMMIFIFLVYDDLKAVKGDVAYDSSTGEKLKWVGAGTLGYIVLPLILIGLMGAFFTSSLFMLKSLWQSPGFEMNIPIEEFKQNNQQPMPPYSEQPTLPVYNEQPVTTYSDKGETADDIGVYIYSINYKGMVKLNGEELYEIKGEKDMNYNYSGGGNFRYGRNVIDVDYTALPDPFMTELTIKVHKYKWDGGKEEILNEWKMNDQGGYKSFEVYIEK